MGVENFMEKVSDTVRPQSINNTLHSLDQQGIDSNNYELHIRRDRCNDSRICA